MRRLLCLQAVCLLLFSDILFSQYSDFDLSRYKLPDIRLNRLDATFNLNNSYSNILNKINDTISDKQRNNRFTGSLNLNYYHFRNTEKYQGSITGILDLDANPSYNRDDNSRGDYKNTSGSLNISSINRFYNSDRNFLEVLPSFSASLYSYSSDLKSDSYPAENSLKQSSTSFELSVPVSVGHGRIEPVEDLRLAIYILEELNKSGRIDSLPSDKVVLDMAKEISKIKRKRFFDTRIRKIKELQVIDSFMVANNIVNKNDIRYFSVLNDQWDYASGPARSAGFSVNAGFDNQFSISRDFQKNYSTGSDTVKNNSGTNNLFIGGFFQLRYFRPINLYWQSSVTLRTSYGILFTDSPLENSSVLNKHYNSGDFNSRLGYTIQFLPDSRTSVSLDINGYYQSISGDKNTYATDLQTFRSKDHRTTFDAGLKMYYYISPQLRIELYSYISNYHQLYLNTNSVMPHYRNVSNQFNHNISFTLTYSFF